MILDARNPAEVPAAVAADIVIIGSGPVGILLAAKLARAKKSVVLVEAGGRVADAASNDQTAETFGRPHKGVISGRAVGLGGTSVLWGGQLAEFEEADLAEWPLTYKELCHHYDRVYNMLGLKSRLPTQACERTFGGQVGGDENIERFFTLWLTEPNFARLFRRDIATNPYVKTVLYATVNSIEFNGRVARAVSAWSDGGRRIQFTGKQFVFAGGTVANCRFFLTVQRDADVPWRYNRLVGRYFQDHLAGKVADVEVTNAYRFREMFENRFLNSIKLQPKLKFKTEARQKVCTGVSGFFYFNSSLSEHLNNIKQLARSLKSGVAFSQLRRLPRDLWVLNRAFMPLVVRYVRDRRITAFFDRGVEFHVQAEQLPVHDSLIRVADGPRRQDGLFRAQVAWKVDGREVNSIRTFATMTGAYLENKGIGRLQMEPRLIRQDFVDTLSDTFHQCGGLRMSSTRAGGVVDPDCRVWDTANVYVAGASVFPTSSHANCTLTALALANRLADTAGASP
jgi:choline dehydrogenase-like flavoprotein